MKSLFGDFKLQKAKVAREMASSYRQIAQHKATTEGATAEETVRDRNTKILNGPGFMKIQDQYVMTRT